MFKNYLKIFAIAASAVLVSVMALNFIVDPAGIYHKGQWDPDSFAAALIESPHGLFMPEDVLDERLVAKALAPYATDKECVVIGSSHVMQISSARKFRSLSNCCKNIMNLGVSGASIEDHITLAYLSLRSPIHDHPRKVILGIDPWTLTYGKDFRWSAYASEYRQARADIFGENNGATSNESASNAKLLNLINIEYTIRSTTALIRNLKHGAPTITNAPELDEAVGGISAVKLPDGSIIYSAKFINDSKKGVPPIGGGSYKTEPPLNDVGAINDYKKLLAWIRQAGSEPVIVLTPYHENVWKAEKSMDKSALIETEQVVRSMAGDLKVKVIGSYNPHSVGCSSEEFYDCMHPKADCLSRLK